MRSRAARIGLSVRRLVIAFKRAPAHFGGDHVGPVQGLDLGDARVHRGGSAYHPGDGLPKTAIGDRAAAMGRGDENNPAHERQGVKGEDIVERFLHLGRGLELVARDGDRGVPERVMRILHHHLGKQAPHAVADQNHPIEGRVGMAGIEVLLSPPASDLTQPGGGAGDRHAGWVNEHPELITSRDRPGYFAAR